MAKQRRKPTPTKASSRKPKAKAAPPKARPARKTAAPAKAKAKRVPAAKTPAKGRSKAQAPATVRKPAAEAAHPPKSLQRVKPVQPPAPPPRRSTYVDAVALYEKGVQFLQSRRFKDAADTFKAVIVQFPEEKELHERARLYILVCERSLAAAPPAQETPDAKVFAATLAINDGQLDRAIGMLSAVLQKDAEHDHACYMLGVALALKGDSESAIQHLARSMALNPENRDLAAKEPDLEALRRTDNMQALLASPPAPLPRKDRPAPARPRRA